MTPAKLCKQYGVTLTELIAATGYTAQNLSHMAKAHPHRLELYVKGLAYDKMGAELWSLKRKVREVLATEGNDIDPDSYDQLIKMVGEWE